MSVDSARRRTASILAAGALALALAPMAPVEAVDPVDTPIPVTSATEPPVLPEPDLITRGLESVALLADEGIEIQRGAEIKGGSVVVRNGTGGSRQWPSQAALVLERDVQVSGYGAVTAADSLHLGRGGVVENAAFNEGVLEGRVERETLTQFTLPLDATPRDLPEPAVSGDDVEVRAGTSAALSAGHYGHLTVGRGATVVLEGGDYGFTSISAAREVRLVVAAESRVGVAGRMVVDRDTQIGLSPAGTVGEASLTVVAWAEADRNPLLKPAIEVGRDAVVAAWLHAPEGSISLGREVRMRGAAAARWISVARDVELSFARVPSVEEGSDGGDHQDMGAVRLEAARELGTVSAEDYARFAVARWFDSDRVPEVFRAPDQTNPADLTVALMSAMRDFESFDPAVQQELYNYLVPGEVPDLPLVPLGDDDLGPEIAMVDPTLDRASLRAGSSTSFQPQRFAGELDNDHAGLGTLECRNAIPWMVQLPPFAFRCKYSTSVADFFFTDKEFKIPRGPVVRASVAPIDNMNERLEPGSNGVPDQIDAAALALIHARNDYRAMGYKAVPKIKVTISDIQGGFALPVIGAIHLNVNSLVYLARHELFHHFQYQYADVRPIAMDYSGQYQTTTAWWLEASAEWATHQAQRRTRDFIAEHPAFADSVGMYAENLKDFLGAPDAPLTRFASPLRGSSGAQPQYGAFIFAEHLEKEFEPEVILSTWQHVGNGLRAIDAIEAAVEEREGQFWEVVESFHLANYTIADSYQNHDPREWLAKIVALDGRPNRKEIPASLGTPQSGSTRVGAGGAVYLEATLPRGAAARSAKFGLDWTTSEADVGAALFRANYLKLDADHKRCAPFEESSGSIWEPFAPYRATFELTPECPTVVVIISHFMANAPAIAQWLEVDWDVSFADIEDGDSDPPPDDPSPGTPELVATGQVHEQIGDGFRQEYVLIEVSEAPEETARDETGLSVSCEPDVPVLGRTPSHIVRYFGGPDPTWSAAWMEVPLEGEDLVDVPFVGRTYSCEIDALSETGHVLASTVIAVVDDSPTRAAVEWGPPAGRPEVLITSLPRHVRSAELSCVAVAYVSGSNSPEQGFLGQAFTTTELIDQGDWRDTTVPEVIRFYGPPSYQFSCTLDLYDHVDPNSQDAVSVATFTGEMETWGLIG